MRFHLRFLGRPLTMALFAICLLVLSSNSFALTKAKKAALKAKASSVQATIRSREASTTPTSSSGSSSGSSLSSSTNTSLNSSKELSFNTKKPWKAARWYLAGQWLPGKGFQWLGGSLQSVKAPSDRCDRGPNMPLIAREKAMGEAAALEISYSDDWVFVELSPTFSSEKFLFHFSDNATDTKCTVQKNMTLGWNAKRADFRPLLFLSPRSNKFFGYQISAILPEESNAATDIQLDLLLGDWEASFPNAAAGATKLHMIPTAIVRGEWLLPFNKKFGLDLSLEQTIMSTGGATAGTSRQKALFSDSQLGAFYERVLGVSDGLRVRGALNYRQHLADDGSESPVLAPANKNMKALIFGVSSDLYFANRWMAGLELSYGLPSKMAGRGVKQGYLSMLTRVAFRTNNFLSLLLEGGYRSYSAEGFSSESVMQIQTGIRLEL